MSNDSPGHDSEKDTTKLIDNETQVEPLAPHDPLDENKPASFDFISENVYITERATSREGKRNKRMMCDCQFDPECDEPSEACGDNCLNRLLMIECGSRCPCGEYCNNKRFTRRQYADVEVFKTELKGWGLRAITDLKRFSFVMEYCGEVCTPEEFESRRREYEKDKRRHYYFMSLKTDEILDATRKGNLSRFINHSCSPNCETQKWTVNGKLRVGFFALCDISSGDELTFDYQFQRFGESAQKCFCSSENCRGYLGVAKQTDSSIRSDLYPLSRSGKKNKPRGNDADSVFEREVYDVVGGSWRLKNTDQVLSFSRLMLRAESFRQRTMLLKVLQATKDLACFKRFLSLQGLRLLWSWMVELSDQHVTEALETKIEILQSLKCLPIPNKNLLTDNKILQIVQKWAEYKTSPLLSNPSVEQESVIISEADCSISHLDYKEEEKGITDASTYIEGKETEQDLQSTPERTKDGVINEMNEAEEQEKGCQIECINSSSTAVDCTSSEAEARETLYEKQDKTTEEVAATATSLLEKWSNLKEVFRIPKKVHKTKTSLEEDESIPKKDTKDDENIEVKRKPKRVSRWEKVDDSNHLSKKRQKLSSPSDDTNLSTVNHSTRAGILGPPPTGIPPLHSTLIVQHQPGQSVYVQQQIFPSVPTINHPASGMVSTQYIPHTTATPPTNHSLIIPPTTLPSLQPLPIATTISYPTTIPSTQPVMSYPGAIDLPLAPLPPPPPLQGLPHNWKEAKDASGKVYYYHVITRKTQWERPTEDDQDGDIMMDLETPDSEDNDEFEGNVRQPHTPEDSPPVSPIDEDSSVKHKKKLAPKDIFKHSLSKLIVKCLDHHRKPDCKYGRITCSEDFKHLARKLTFGITEKEVNRKGSPDLLVFTDQVKSRTKDYIKNYMKKFGPIYSHS